MQMLAPLAMAPIPVWPVPLIAMFPLEQLDARPPYSACRRCQRDAPDGAYANDRVGAGDVVLTISQ